MTRQILLDTGPLLSLLNSRQEHHHRCQRIFRSLEAAYVTTEAVVTETSYFLSKASYSPAVCAELVINTDTSVMPCNEGRLERAAELLRKYEDVGMDFADAMLVAIAEETGIREVFTLDRHFHIYRIGGRKAFTVIPDLST